MLTLRSFSLLVLSLVGCSASKPEASDPAPEQVGGGQSGTDANGALGQRCDPVGEAESVPTDETIETFGRSAEDLADALAGVHVLACEGGDGGTCADFGTLSVEVTPTGVATVQPGELYYFFGSEDMPAPMNGDPTPCAIVRIGAEVRIQTSNGTLDVTATELVFKYATHAGVNAVGPTTLFGDEQDIDVYVGFAGVTDTPRSIDAVLEIDATHRALYSWERGESGEGGAGGVGNGSDSGGAGGADDSGEPEGGAGGSGS